MRAEFAHHGATRAKSGCRGASFPEQWHHPASVCDSAERMAVVGGIRAVDVAVEISVNARDRLRLAKCCRAEDDVFVVDKIREL